jgi:hypothetical protein
LPLSACSCSGDPLRRSPVLLPQAMFRRVSRLHPDGSPVGSAVKNPARRDCTSGKVRQRRRRCRHAVRSRAGRNGFRRPSRYLRRVNSRSFLSTYALQLLARGGRSNRLVFKSGALLAWCHRSASSRGSMKRGARRRATARTRPGDRLDNSPSNQKQRNTEYFAGACFYVWKSPHELNKPDGP